MYSASGDLTCAPAEPRETFAVLPNQRKGQTPEEEAAMLQRGRDKVERIGALIRGYSKRPKRTPRWVGSRELAILIVVARSYKRTYLGMDMPVSRFGEFNRWTGIMTINPKNRDNYEDARQNTVLLHELAHAVGTGHDTQWLDAWTLLLQLATTQLGWPCKVICNGCINYGLCPKSICQKHPSWCSELYYCSKCEYTFDANSCRIESNAPNRRTHPSRTPIVFSS